jgi:hypothetical protein
LKAPHSKCGIRVTVSGVRIPPSPPRTEYLTCLAFLTFLLCKFFRWFRDFAPIEQRQCSRRDEFVRHLPQLPRARLVRAFWWYGSLCPANRIRAGRARRIMRDTRRMVGSCTERQRADANPRRRPCSFHSSGSLVSSMRRRAVSSGGCLPLRIALTISGARRVRRKSRVA